MNQKGLSDIVTAILFILLILIAIGIIWSFLRPTVESTSQVQGAQNCLLQKLDVTRCVYSGDANEAYASVMLSRGADSLTLSDVKIVFANEAGTNTQVRNWDQHSVGGALPAPYESTGAGFYLGALLPSAVAVAGIVGEDTVCPVVDSIPCTPYQYELGTGCQDFDRDGSGDGIDYDRFVGCYETETLGHTQGEPCIYDYNPQLRRQRVDESGDGGVTLDDFDAFVSAFVIGDMDGC